MQHFFEILEKDCLLRIIHLGFPIAYGIFPLRQIRCKECLRVSDEWRRAASSFSGLIDAAEALGLVEGRR